uniref:Putative nuclease HARBI1 n=1 Tax=Lygus hesperus TaxID=30085 RepID=A0A0A9X6A9_LYGHE
MDIEEIASRIIWSEENSSDDEFERPSRPRKPRFLRDSLDHFQDLDDFDFSKRFRLSKGSALQVLVLIESRLEYPTDKNDAVAPMNQLLLALRYYATGCTQLAAADFSGVSEPTSHRIVHRVSAALVSLYRQFIFLPRSESEIAKTQRDFYQEKLVWQLAKTLKCKQT